MSYKVLIVEDDPMVSMINEQYVCKNQDFSVVASCRNGQDALDYLKSNEVDLILLDVYMPLMNGIETLKKIREMKVDSEVIMVTAANDTMTIEDTMHLGVLDYLIKPFAYERFEVALEKFISKINLLKGREILDQRCVDSIIANLSSVKTEEKNYPKGIQEKTLVLVLNYFKKNPQWCSADMIAENLGISIVTVRNYLNYLTKQGTVIQDINYETGGRPCMLYRGKDK